MDYVINPRTENKWQPITTVTQALELFDKYGRTVMELTVEERACMLKRNGIIPYDWWHIYNFCRYRFNRLPLDKYPHMLYPWHENIPKGESQETLCPSCQNNQPNNVS